MYFFGKAIIVWEEILSAALILRWERESQSRDWLFYAFLLTAAAAVDTLWDTFAFVNPNIKIKFGRCVSRYVSERKKRLYDSEGLSVFVWVQVCVCVCERKCACVSASVRVWVQVCVCEDVWACVSVCERKCACVSTCVAKLGQAAFPRLFIFFLHPSLISITAPTVSHQLDTNRILKRQQTS